MDGHQVRKMSVMRVRKRAPIHPGRLLLKDYIEPMALTITSLAELLGVSRKTVSAIVNERKSVTPDMALRLSRAFGTSPELWLNLQKTHDLWHAAQANSRWQDVKPVRRNDCSSAPC